MIPPCWFLHPVAVEELTALMVAWKAAYSQKQTAPSDSPVNWHDRWLWPTLHRLNVQLACGTNGGTHTPSRPGPLPDEASFTSFLAIANGASPQPDEPCRGHLGCGGWGAPAGQLAGLSGLASL
jgi:hypothetical protein